MEQRVGCGQGDRQSRHQGGTVPLAAWVLSAMLGAVGVFGMAAVGTAAGTPTPAPSTSTAAPGMSSPATMDQATYRLGPGDGLRISVFGHDELTLELTVRPDGRISYPLVGDMEVSGQTPGQVSQRIQEVLSAYVKSPQVTVMVTQFRQVHVQVSGEVVRPGLYLLPVGASILDAFGQAGGWTRQAAISQVLLIRHGQAERLDLRPAIEKGQTQNNIRLEDGDLLYLPPAATAVVWGEVRTPGAYTLAQETNLVQLLALAGGTLATADLQAIQVSRVGDGGIQRQTIPSDQLQHWAVQAGDIIYVPPVQSVTVLGAVARPGRYPLADGVARLWDVLAQAGGPTSQAAVDRVTITRVGPDGTPVSIGLDLTPAPDGGVPKAGSYALQANDLIYVPEGRQEVVVLGQVQNPGVVPWRAGMRVLDLLAAAGGLTDQAAGERATLALAKDGKTITIDLTQLPQAASELNRPLQPGDTLFVPAASRQVAILGEVARPGLYPFTPGLRLLDLVAAAGGWSEWADRQAVSLMRQASAPAVQADANAQGASPATVQVLDGEAAEHDSQQNVPLQVGDLVVVRRAVRSTLVLGEVRQPGIFPYRPGQRLVDLVAAAGGLTPQARQGRALLTRLDPQTGEPGAPQWVALYPDSSNGAVAGNTPASSWTGNDLVKPGDILYVPAAPQAATVLGEVARPGQYPVEPGWRVLDLLAAAGGPTPTADLLHASFTSAASESEGAAGAVPQIIDLEAIQKAPQSSANELVQPGDVLVVPRNQQWVSTLGEWNRPATLPWRPGLTLGELVTAAGGPTPQADLEHVNLIRQAGDRLAYQTVSLAGWLGSSGTAQAATPANQKGTGAPAASSTVAAVDGTMVLQPGDVIMTRPLPPAMVLGEVARPGAVALLRPSRLADVLAQVGGPTAQAALDQVALIRGTVQQRVDLRAAWQGMPDAENPWVSPGDTVVVPAGMREVFVLGAVARPGAYPVQAGQTLGQVLALAGGATVSGDPSRAVWVRQSAGGGAQLVNLTFPDGTSGPAPGEQQVSPGDLLYIPESRRAILVLGEVRAPQQIVVWPGMRLLEAVARAGGPTPSADLHHALFSQGGQVETLDLAALLANPLAAENRVLNGDEVLILPRQLQGVAVLGAVRQPGSYPLEQPATLVSAVAAAGGVLESADLEAALLTHTGATGERTAQRVDVKAALENPAGPANVAVQGGDVLFIPEQERRVLVYGAVRSPGAYLVKPDARVLDVLGMAGGPTEQADLAALTLTRTRASGTSSTQTTTVGQEVIDLGRLLQHPEDPTNRLLAPGDVLYLPQARQVAVLGQVARPGTYTLLPGSRLLDLLALAGGPTANAADELTVLRTPLGEGQPQVLSADYRAVLGNQQPDQNVVLQPGDTVYVPESRQQVLVLGQVRNPGLYPIRPGMTVLDVIGLAGGPAERASLDAVGIYRSGQPGGHATVALGKDKVVFQGNVKENPLVQAGDIVYVPETSKPDWNSIFGFLGGVKLFKDLLGIQIQW
ncbi:MAG: SLBB domain-containing protein [Limnochordaceae bacterium]|nr:SLBB domain-containing protein [Limnochordaceae bacterium]